MASDRPQCLLLAHLAPLFPLFLSLPFPFCPSIFLFIPAGVRVPLHFSFFHLHFFFLYHLRFSLASPPPLRANYIYSFVSVQYPSALLTSLRNFVCPFSAVLLSCSLACLLLNLIVIFLVSLAFLFRCGRRFISLRLCLVYICCLTSLCCQLFSVILLYIYICISDKYGMFCRRYAACFS